MPSALRTCRSALALLAVPTLCNFALCLSTRAQSTPSSPSEAQIDEIVADVNRARAIGEVAVSPDGKRLAWSEGKEIFVAPIGNIAASQHVTASTSGQHCVEEHFIWSPDSSSLAFISDCAHPTEQDDLYLSLLNGNAPVRLTELRGEVSAPAFSPDGKAVAFFYVKDGTRPADALAAMTAPSGVIGEDHIEIQRVATVSAGATQPQQAAFVTPANLHVYEFDWSPDSQSLAFIAANPPGDDNWWLAKLYTQNLAPGHLGIPALGIESGDAPQPSPHVVLDPVTLSGPLHGLQIAVPRWSPDGQVIAFIGGLMSDQGVTGGDVWVVSAQGGQPRNVTPNRPTSSQWITWDGDTHLYSSEVAGGRSQFVRIRLSGDRTSESVSSSFAPPVFSIIGSIGPAHRESEPSFNSSRTLFVFAASAADHPPEIYAAGPDAPHEPVYTGPFDGLAQLTHFNDGLKPSWGPTVLLDWKNENFNIQGWLRLPINYDPSKKYPLIVEVHGGPASSVLSRWGGTFPFSPAVFSELGYFVFQPNPRGGYGQGEAFTQANRKDFGYGDLRDILAGVDTILARYSVDPNRIGLDGWSYGGFMTMFAVTQTHRFRAAVAGAGISDWLSYYGENSIDRWMIPYFGASVYDDPQVYARSSAINFIKNVSTPTLALVGDRDGECPAPQSFEFWHALRDLNVPTQLVVYPDEGHGISDPTHRRDVLQRAVEWFGRYMPPDR
jgi:dipeptidyl aminopeptidase/acylaminoacyl peptidase